MIAFASRAWFDCRWHNASGIEGTMVAFVLLGLMESPVLIKVMAGTQGPQTQDRFGAFQAPAGAGYFHAIFDKMTAGAFYDSRSNWKTLSQVVIVFEIGAIGEQVVRAGVYGFSILSGKISQCGAAAHASCCISGI